MSVKDPYVVDENSPRILKNLITRYPQVLQLNGNIIEDKPIESSIHFDSSSIPLESDDPQLQWLLEQMIKFELIKENKKMSCGYEALQSGIIFNSSSFNNRQNRDLGLSRMVQMKSAIMNNLDKPMATGQFSGSISPENKRKMLEEVGLVLQKYIVESESGSCNILLNLTLQET